MEQGKCCCCGLSIGRLNTVKIAFHGHELSVCQYCGDAFKKVDTGDPKKIESGKKYLRARLEENEAAPIAIPLIQETLGEAIDKDVIEKAIADLPFASKTAEAKKIASEVSHIGPFAAGICFLILTAFLYYISTNNSYGVANIPSTIFAAASFVAAIVCFGTSAIIKAINTK